MRPTLRLRDYQKDLFDKARTAFRNGKRRVLVVAPCGAGKTAIAAAMMQATLKQNPKGECLMLVHRRELLTQHMDTLKGYGVDTSRIRVESVFTEARRLGKRKRPLLLILDESHLAKAASWERVVEYYNTWTVGFTATPIRLDGRPLDPPFQSMVEGITHKELEAMGRLAPYDYYAPQTPDLTAVRSRGGDFAAEELEELVCKRAIYGDVLKSYQKFAYGKRAIAFCVNVRHSREVAEMFLAAGIPAASLDGSMSKKTRSAIMQKFRSGEIQILSSCNIISEGISVDECECCLLLRPTDSLALYIQQACRCLRYVAGKRAVILDFCGNYRHGLPSFQREWSLTSGAKTVRQHNSDGSLAMRSCNYCFKTFENKGGVNVCPYCSEPYECKIHELKKIREVELARIDQAKAEAEQARKAKVAKDIRAARSRADFETIAKANGYSREWVKIRCRLRGYK